MRFEVFKIASDDPQSRETVIINLDAVADITYPGKYVSIELTNGRKFVVDVNPNELKKKILGDASYSEREEKRERAGDLNVRETTGSEMRCPFCGAKIIPKDYRFDDGSVLQVRACASCGKGVNYKISPSGEVREVRGK